jgi:2-polyprenyl-3-methyl-5-hydroxy-6-metoxy-1,4-benzoquinol methylase
MQTVFLFEIIMKDFDAQSYWEQRLSSGPGIHKVGHLAYGYVFNAALYSLRKNLVNSVLRTLFIDINPSTLSVLDIGCGTGFYLSLWQNFGVKNIHGVDFTQSSIDYCLDKFPQCTLIKADISDETALSSLGVYSCISVFDVLFHIVDDEKYNLAIKNIASHVKEDGILLYSDNFLRYDTKREKHIVHRSLSHVSDILQKNGFEIIKRQPMFYVMGYPIDVKSRFWGKLWNIFMYPVRKSEVIGALYAFILYPIEWLLIRIFRESPTTELMICKKKAR